jgi:hypothetical protein
MTMLSKSVRDLESGGGNGNGNGHEHSSHDELAELLESLETDPGVTERLVSLSGSRQGSVIVRDRVSEKVERVTAAVPRSAKSADVYYPLIVYRDVDDVTTILNLTRLLIVMAVVIVASGAANIYQYYRRPDRIVVDGGSGRVLSINDRNYGKEENVEFGPDRLTVADKLYITREFVRRLYQVDPATRPRDIEKALTMMVPESAVKFSTWMKERGILDQQKAESWQASWTQMDMGVDPNDPYSVNVIGRQEINKVVAGAVQKEIKQLRLTIKLVADNKGRADRNLRSGFLISYLDSHELNDSGAAASPETQSQSSGTKRVTPVTALQDQP